jgi:hypothetical protein
MKNFIYLISSLILIFSGCIRNDCYHHYVFEAPLEVTPIGSTLHVGDTLHILMITDNKQLHDTARQRVVEIPDFNPFAVFQLPIIDSFPVKEGFVLNEVLVDTSAYDFQFLNTEHLGIGLFFFDIPKNEYESKIEFKVVLNTVGQYMFVCRDGLFDFDKYNNTIEFPERCGKGDLGVYFNITQGDHSEILENKHIEILDEYWKDSSGDKSESDMYYFRVIE